MYILYLILARTVKDNVAFPNIIYFSRCSIKLPYVLQTTFEDQYYYRYSLFLIKLNRLASVHLSNYSTDVKVM